MERTTTRRIAVLLALVALFGATTQTPPGHARTWHILADGSGDAPTIQAGIDSSAHYDTVLVAPGTYFESIGFDGKKIVVGSYFASTQDTSYISQTVIDAGPLFASCVGFTDAEERQSILTGLTLAHGHGTWNGYLWGGGIFCLGASPTLSHLIIRDCMFAGADEFGGGIAVLGGAPLIDNVEIRRCAATEGGGLQCEGPNAHPIVLNTRITGCEANIGPAVSVYGGATVRLEQVVLDGNVAHSSGDWSRAISTSSGGEATIIRSTLTGNDTGALAVSYNGRARVIDSILWGDGGAEIVMFYASDSGLVVSHCDIEGGQAGIATPDSAWVAWLEGNLDVDPLFTDPDAGDYSLQIASECIDAGTAHFEWLGSVLLDLDPNAYCGAAPEIGAWEYCPDAAGVAGDAGTGSGPSRAAGSGLRLDLRAQNPGRGSTMLELHARSGAGREEIVIGIFDASGRCIRRLEVPAFGVGTYRVTWDGCDAAARRMPSGCYLARTLARGARSGTAARIVLMRD